MEKILSGGDQVQGRGELLSCQHHLYGRLDLPHRTHHLELEEGVTPNDKTKMLVSVNKVLRRFVFLSCDWLLVSALPNKQTRHFYLPGISMKPNSSRIGL